MGDFNSRLSRNEDGYVGRWCIHKRRDSGGDILLHIMKMFSLKCVSTYFQPRKNHTNEIFMNIEPNKPPSQIDYILVSARWASSVKRSKTKWGVPISTYGRKYDHALVRMTFKVRLKCERKYERKNFSVLKEPKSLTLMNRW